MELREALELFRELGQSANEALPLSLYIYTHR